MAIDRPVVVAPDFDQLVDEAVQGLPRLAPGWTDHNAHDPGITLIELFAWLTEAGLYRAERTTPMHYRSFARRLGIFTRPQTTAEVILQLAAPTDPAWDRWVPSDIQVHSEAVGIVFSTSDRVRLHATIDDPVLVGEHKTALGWPDEAPCLPFGEQPGIGTSFELLFAHPIEGPLSLYLWSGAEDHDRATITALKSRASRAVCEADQSWFVHYSAQLAWEFLSPDGSWIPAVVLADETRALSISGIVRLEAAAPHGANTEGMYPLRCRLAGGGYDCAPSVRRVLVNAVRARHQSAAEPSEVATEFTVLGTSRGHASEAWSLPHFPLVWDQIEIRVVEPSADIDDEWIPVMHWDRSGPHDRHILFDAERGVLTFGDGRVGWVPSPGSDVAVRYRRGGGEAGNVSAQVLSAILGENPHDIEVRQPFAAAGGAAPETTEALRARLLAERNRISRAVTLADIEQLAMSAPGLPVARARALAEHHPEHLGLLATGCVSVVVLPPCPDEQPYPTQPLLDAIARFLEPLRSLTTELHVVAPEYTTIAIAARLHVAPGLDASAVVADAEEAFARWIHPIHGGPNAAGWRPGRDLHRAEVLALLMNLDGVHAVDDFAFLLNGRETQCESVALCNQALFTPVTHQIKVYKESADVDL